MSEFAARIDVREYATPKDKQTNIFIKLNSLSTGEKMELINDHDPIHLYQKLLNEYPNQYKWEYLQEGPEIWRISIKKI
jgi:uncharacterized protein (DUF2249 family)